jgi:HK97 family phage portal protein
MTPFSWVETVLTHLLLWREAYLWHEERDSRSGFVSVYRPIRPDAFEPVKRVNGKRVFTYTDADTKEKKEVGSEQITYIPGPSLDGVRGHPMLQAARSIFSAAISGDKTAQAVLRRGIRLAGLVTPADEAEDFDETEGDAMLEKLRATAVGRENAGGVVMLNKRLKLQPWQPNNIESQWHETRGDVLGEIGRIFGMPPHLLNDIEKQTSWGTGVAEQNLGLARYTLMGWSSRIEQVLTQRLPRDQFVEFDYKGLLQGTPAQEIELLIAQKDAGVLTQDEVRKILNLPPLTPAQKAEFAPPPAPRPIPLPDRQEATA